MARKIKIRKLKKTFLYPKSQLVVQKDKDSYILRYVTNMDKNEGFVLLRISNKGEAILKAEEYMEVYAIPYGLKIID